MMIKSSTCPSNPKLSDIKPITSVLSEYIDSPVLALAHWRNENYTRLSQNTLNELPETVRNMVEEFISFFNQYGIGREHLISPISDKTTEKYVDARRSIVLICGKRKDGHTNSIMSVRITHTPKYYRGTRNNALTYNRKVNASQATKQYDYKPR